MAESTGHQQISQVKKIFHGEGRAEHRKKEVVHPDTLYNKHMQEVFDVVAPEANAEIQDAIDARAELATLTAEALAEKSTAWKRFKEHKNPGKFILDLDTEWRGHDVPRRLERILTHGILGSVSAAMDFGGDIVTNQILKDKNRTAVIPRFNFIPLDKNNGNREAVEKGWEMLTDEAIGAFSDMSVKLATNRTDFKFVSPLSDTLSKIGNVASALAGKDKHSWKTRALDSFVNPSSIEAGFRAASAVPLGGVLVEKVYAYLNKLLKQEGSIIPIGFDVAVAVVAAKTKHHSHAGEAAAVS